MMLAEGQAQNDVEVKQIDEKAGIVKLVNHGEAQTLDFDHDGAKPSGPPPGSPPNATGFPPPAMPPPNVMPAPGNVIRPLRSLPQRGTPFSSMNGNGVGGNGMGNGQSGGGLTPEEQVALIEVQRMKYQQDNDPMSKIFPPTVMTPENGSPAPQ
jgi:hypothetical protein